MADGKKYHINPDTGKPNVCTATGKRGCKYKAEDGTEPPHFPTKEAAQEYQNKRDEAENGLVPSVRKPSAAPAFSTSVDPEDEKRLKELVEDYNEIEDRMIRLDREIDGAHDHKTMLEDDLRDLYGEADDSDDSYLDREIEETEVRANDVAQQLDYLYEDRELAWAEQRRVQEQRDALREKVLRDSSETMEDYKHGVVEREKNIELLERDIAEKEKALARPPENHNLGLNLQRLRDRRGEEEQYLRRAREDLAEAQQYHRKLGGSISEGEAVAVNTVTPTGRVDPPTIEMSDEDVRKEMQFLDATRNDIERAKEAMRNARNNDEMVRAFLDVDAATERMETSMRFLELAGKGHLIPNDGPTLRVRNMAQKHLFRKNSVKREKPGEWNPWQGATIIVDPTNVGRNFDAPESSYSSQNVGLGEGSRATARDDITNEPMHGDGYSDEAMEADLSDLHNIFAIKR